MKIAIIGLGKMGHQFVVKLKSDGHEVIVLDNDPEQVKRAVSDGAVGAGSREDVLSKFGDETPVVWLMIPSSAVDDEIKAWSKILTPGSILIDGGNSRYTETLERETDLAGLGIKFIDVGTSGGVLGLKNGFCMMIGGDEAVVKSLESVFSSLAKPDGAYEYFGASGSGHYIKMIHNAIEYGYMESLAEGYRMLAEGPIKKLDLAAIARVWQHGSIVKSELNELAGEIFTENPSLEGVDGVVAETGEARWTIEEANRAKIDLPAIEVALDVRRKSQSGEISFATKLLALLRNKFGGHNTNPK